MAFVYLNGEFLPAEEAHVSVLDRGFLFADGVYEVIPAYGGRLFRLHQHLLRLERSLDAIRLANPLGAAQWQEILETLLERNGGGDQSVYLQITRGVMPQRDHRFPENPEPTVLAMTTPLIPPDIKTLSAGVSAITMPDPRWQHCHIKSIALLPNVLLRQQAQDSGSSEAILVRDGLVTEGSASNVFAVIGSTLVTPPTGPLLLPGITRDLILEITQSHGIPLQETELTLLDLQTADEIWVTSSTREIVPVVELDGSPVGSGKAGPNWERMIRLYQSYKDDVRAGKAS